MKRAAAAGAKASGERQGESLERDESKGEEVTAERYPLGVVPAGQPLPPGFVQTNLFAAMRDRKNQDTVRKLYIASACMAVFPLSGFFVVRHVLLPHYGIRDNVDLISALVAVFVVQLVIAGYVISAFREPADDSEELLQEQAKVDAARASAEGKKTD
mmetsp:Transcript_5471/g.14079  ORF Transcript_5471/g.14079 Transcript_5471/m.14079 type:complete len:158 (-) Transcript_5471:415-888(-)